MDENSKVSGDREYYKQSAPGECVSSKFLVNHGSKFQVQTRQIELSVVVLENSVFLAGSAYYSASLETNDNSNMKSKGGSKLKKHSCRMKLRHALQNIRRIMKAATVNPN